MSIPARYDITHYQGDTYDLIVKIPIDLTTANVKFELKLSGAGAATLELYEGFGITVDTFDAIAGTNTVYIQITGAQSTTLGTNVYFYDLETTMGGQITTWLTGTYAQMAQVTT